MKRLLSGFLCLLALAAFMIPVYAEDEPAAEEQQVQEQPAEEAPAEEQPAEEAPAEEQPAEEQPSAEEQPAAEVQPVAEEQPAEEEKQETVKISLDLTDAWAGRAFELTAPGGVSVQAAASEEGTVTFEAPSARYYAIFPAGGESPAPPEDIQAAEEEPEAAAEEGDVTILVYLGKNWAGTVFSARTELTDYPEEFSVSPDGVLTLSLEDSADFWAGTELAETAVAAADTETASKSSDSGEEESSDLMVFLYFGGLAVIAICYGIYRLRKRAAARTEDKKKEEDDEEDEDEYDDEEEEDDEYGRFRREDEEDGPWRG